MKRKLIEHISSLLQQYKTNESRLEKSPNDVLACENAKRWKGIAEDNLLYLAKNALPHGSGIDCGTQIAIDASKPDKLILYTSFHHMDEHGGYDGWSEHKVTVSPSFQGFDIVISGRNRNDIKEYLYQIFEQALSEIWEQTADENKPFVCPALIEASRQWRFQCVTNELLQKTPDKLTDENRQWIAEYKAFQAEQDRITAGPDSPVQVSRALQASIVKTLDDYTTDIESCMDTDCPEMIKHDKERQSAIEAIILELKNCPLAKGA